MSLGTRFPRPDVGTDLVNGAKDVTTAGTAEALATSQEVRGVTVRAKAANTGDVYVGEESTVSSSNGFTLAAGEAITLYVRDVAEVWVDVATNGEGVEWIAEVD